MSLSNKIKFDGETAVLLIEDVREAVRELKDIFCCCRKESLRLCVNCKDFKKIFGEKLI